MTLHPRCYMARASPPTWPSTPLRSVGLIGLRGSLTAEHGRLLPDGCPLTSSDNSPAYRRYSLVQLS